MSRMELQSFLTDLQRREIEDVRQAAERILRQPLDHAYTDHTIAHSERIRSHLDLLLGDWVCREIQADEERARAEIFILLAAVYLHDIGMQFQRFDCCASLEENLPALAEELERRGLGPAEERPPFTPETLAFARRHHHLITYDWLLASSRLPDFGLHPFEPTGLKSHVQHVARVSWAHNVWLTNDHSYEGYEHLLANAQEQEGEIRLSLLAAFLRLGDLLDLDFRRVDLSRLRRFDIPLRSKSHWWRHHFVRTCRLDAHNSDRGRPLYLVFSLPEEHRADREWLDQALYSATVEELKAEQLRLTRWLAPAGVWIDLPSLDRCEIRADLTGQVVPMPPEVLEELRKTWPGAEGESAQVRVQTGLSDGSLTSEVLGDQIRALGVRVEIEDYLRQVEAQHERGFRNTPYTPLEIDYGEFTDALDALKEMLSKPDPIPRPVVLVGDPGGGKTTLVRRYVLDCARRLRTPEYLPIYVQANRYGEPEWTEEIHRRLGSASQPAPQAEYQAAVNEMVQRLLFLLAETLCDLAGVSYRHREAILHHLLEIMARRNCLIVLDGLNEIPPSPRSLAIHAVRAFVEEYPSHRVVITSRKGDYHEDYFPSSPAYTVQPLKEEAIRSYWDALGISSVAQSHVLTAEGGAVGELARNPMYMFMLGELLKSHDTGTITHAGRLFQRFTQETLLRWHRGDSSPLLEPEEMQDLLSEVAFHALDEQAVSFDRRQLDEGVSTWWTAQPKARRHELASRVGAEAVEGTGSGAHLITVLLEKMLGTGLLQSQGDVADPRYKFQHHTSQDYFTALSIRGKVDQLPRLVGRPVFHEPLRLVPGLIDNPNEFLTHLIASTSPEFGRGQLLGLSFRVAGAVRAPLQPDVLRQLFGGAVPLLHAAVELRLPYAAEVLGDLFCHLGWALLARFLAQVSQTAELSPFLRAFAREQIATMLTQENQAQPGTISGFLGSAISHSIWSDYFACKEALWEEADFGSERNRFPILFGGLASSISLNVDEKLGIAKRIGRLTPNQIGLLEMILINEILHWGGLSLTDENVIANLTGLHHEWATMLLLQNEDVLILCGRLPEAINSYFDAWQRVEVKYPLLYRLIVCSSGMSAEQLKRLELLIKDYDGEEIGIPCENVILSVVETIKRRGPLISYTIVEAIERKQTESSNPWLVLWYDFIFSPVRPPVVGRRFDDLISRIDHESPMAPAFLHVLSTLGNLELQEKVKRFLAEFEESRPAHGIERTKKLLAEIPEDQIASELYHQLTSLGFHTQFLTALMAPVLDRLDMEQAVRVIEGLNQIDHNLRKTAELLLLQSLAHRDGAEEVERLMERWGIKLGSFPSGHSDLRHSIFRSLFKSGRRDEVFRALGWNPSGGRQTARTRPHALLLEGKDGPPLLKDDEDLPLLIEFLEMEEQSDEAFQLALDALGNSSPQSAAQRGFYFTAFRLAETETDPTRAEERFRRLGNVLLKLLGQPLSSAWVFDSLERLRMTQRLDLVAYGDGLEKLLTSVYSVLDYRRRYGALNALSEMEQHDRVLRCLDAYVRACPPDAAMPTGYLGNAAWCAYLAGDDFRFLDLTDTALSLLPQADNDWLLCNRAFALWLNGREDEARLGYEKARKAVSHRKQWNEVALKDLELHESRRPQSKAIRPDLIEQVRCLGADLPEGEEGLAE